MKSRRQILGSVVLSAAFFGAASGCSSTTAFPTPDQFIQRWNAPPVLDPSQDIADVKLGQWKKCPAGGQYSACLHTSFCRGQGSVTAVMKPNADGYLYYISITQGYEFTNRAGFQCMGIGLRAVNTLFDSPPEALKAVKARINDHGERIQLDGVSGDKEVIRTPIGIYNDFSPSLEGDQSVEDLVNYWFSTKNIMIVETIHEANDDQ